MSVFWESQSEKNTLPGIRSLSSSGDSTEVTNDRVEDIDSNSNIILPSQRSLPTIPINNTKLMFFILYMLQSLKFNMFNISVFSRSSEISIDLNRLLSSMPLATA